MRTTYLTSVTTAFNTFSRTSKVPRLFLTLLPPNAHKFMQIRTTQLPLNSTQPGTLELGFKGGRTLKYSWSEWKKGDEGKTVEKPPSIEDVVYDVDRDARITGRKEELEGR